MPEHSTPNKELWSRRNPWRLKRLLFKGIVAFRAYKTQCLRLRRNCCCNQYFCKLAALMTSTIIYAPHWLSNYKKVSQVLIYTKIFYFALTFQIKQFLKCSSSAAALMLCSLQEIKTSALIFFPFYAASSLYKKITESCCFTLYKNKHIWFVHNKTLKILNSHTQKTPYSVTDMVLISKFSSSCSHGTSLYKCRKPDCFSVQQCSFSNKKLLNNREKQ